MSRESMGKLVAISFVAVIALFFVFAFYQTFDNLQQAAPKFNFK